MRPTNLIAVLLVATVAVAIAMMITRSPSADAGPLRVRKIVDMRAQRAAHQATLLPDGQVLITGGCAGQGCASFNRSAEIYDPATRTFRAAAPMSIPRASHTATLLRDGRVLVAGGCSDDGVTASAEVYDVAANRWSPVGDMTEPRCSQIAVPLADGRVFIMGGGGGRLGDLATAEIFDPVTSSFSSLGRMHSNHNLATRLADGRVLLTGGQDAEGRILRSAEIFGPVSGKFEPTGNMAVARVKHAAALLEDGRVLILGGSDRRGYDARFGSTEIYDPQTGRFTPGPDMRSPRHKFRDAVAVLPSGAVLVAGGAPRPEFCDPAARAFVGVRGGLGRPWMFATATALRTGEVLLTGGYDHELRSSAAAWIISSSR